jgi:3-dehydroquinate synthase
VLEIPVELGPRSYVVSVGHGLAAELPALLGGPKRRSVVVADRRVWSRHGARLQRGLARLGAAHRVLIPPGERFKSRRSLAALHDAFVDARLGRDGRVIAVGGGVVGDLAGFAAATWMRGIDWVQVPTTLLAMVDSSVGGKVGINHPEAKNLIGAFHQPGAVVADPELLDTLAPRQRRSGCYEVLKAGLIGDRDLFAAMAGAPPGLRGWDRPAVENAIAAAVRVKAQVVERDEREGGLRRVLNLGHTVGHALETLTRYRRFTHGEAVGWGLLAATWIARRRGLVGEASAAAIDAAVAGLGPRPPVHDLDPGDILAALARDKKAVAGRVPFVLPRGLGRVVIAGDVSRGEIRSALRALARIPAR